MKRQPLLQDRLVCLAAPTQAWSGPDGQIRAGAGIDGIYHADVRILSSSVLLCQGQEPESISAHLRGAGQIIATSVVRTLAGPTADPFVRIDRLRSVHPGQVVEQFTLTTASASPVDVTLQVKVAADLATMDEVKMGAGRVPVQPSVEGAAAGWVGDDISVTLHAAGADLSATGNEVHVTWTVTASANAPAVVAFEVTALDANAAVVAGPAPCWTQPDVTGVDDRLQALLAQSIADIGGLVMAAAGSPTQPFLAAGAPWFFTLFGRDSLWAARMLLPLGTELAAGTLRTLADFQGTKSDPATAEQPGKILHEVRRAAIDLDDGTHLPPVYYGTVDATPLWLCLLHDAWRWGMSEDIVRSLLPAAQRALEWMVSDGDADGDGFLEYVDESGRGLANQGWKDSGDSIRWRDGSLAQGTIALCEVQAYAYEAAMGAADMCDAFDVPGGDRWRGWASELRRRFHEQFWVDDGHLRYPAIALDGDKRPVDSLTSNLGHLIGTGLLDADQERAVADLLLSPQLSSGFGLHTLAQTSGGFWPLSYHGGSVWTHDTAIAIAGMTRAGLVQQARGLSQQVLAAARAFDYRLPELFSGDRAEQVSAPAPYPAACRPQAWSAASSVVLLTAALGLRPNVPAGTLVVQPTVPGPFTVDGLRLGEHAVNISGKPGAVAINSVLNLAVEVR